MTPRRRVRQLVSGKIRQVVNPLQIETHRVAVVVQCQLARQEFRRRLMPDTEEQARHRQVLDLQVTLLPSLQAQAAEGCTAWHLQVCAYGYRPVFVSRQGRNAL